MTTNLKKTIFPIVIAITLTIILVLIYILEQQNLRQAANNPQIQIAQSLTSQLSQKKQTNLNTAGEKIDLAKSPNPFTILFNEKQQIIYSNAILNNKTPILPSGVLENVKKTGETKITWQPKEGVRIATVIKYYSGLDSGYVLVGRSLQEAEKKIAKLNQEIVITWLAMLILTGAFLFVRLKNPPKK